MRYITSEIAGNPSRHWVIRLDYLHSGRAAQTIIAEFSGTEAKAHAEEYRRFKEGQAFKWLIRFCFIMLIVLAELITAVIYKEYFHDPSSPRQNQLRPRPESKPAPSHATTHDLYAVSETNYSNIFFR